MAKITNPKVVCINTTIKLTKQTMDLMYRLAADEQIGHLVDSADKRYCDLAEAGYCEYVSLVDASNDEVLQKGWAFTIAGRFAHRYEVLRE